MLSVRKIFIILLIVIIAFSTIFYLAIVITNNSIADKIEKDIVSYELPTNTKLIDSLSAAGKLTGSGNGMQYMGAILIESDLSADEIKEYYSSEFDYIEVNEQETVNLSVLQNVSFNADIESGEKTYYSIICWDDQGREMFGDFVSKLLDFDIRGH